ncbi:MAG TPA: T9SS type A sorting domain-containing protein [Bacteroidota bacterium]|nr:T9SS type A sorting domain-containing protein [Bacteroidota bacterium]
MLGQTRNGIRISVLAAAIVMLQATDAIADNQLLLKKVSNNVVTLELNNTDAVAGFQFSINGRGGLTFGTYEGSERTAAAALGIYQFLKDDSTLNVVILAPVRSALPAGSGTIGSFSYSQGEQGVTSARVFLSNVVLCTAEAQKLQASSVDLQWDTNSRAVAGQQAFALEPNYPNPFNPSTTISYRLDKPSTVHLAVYDITGRVVETLVDMSQQEGRYSVRWNAGERPSARVASGMYFARLQVGDQVQVQKMILAK